MTRAFPKLFSKKRPWPSYLVLHLGSHRIFASAMPVPTSSFPKPVNAYKTLFITCVETDNRSVSPLRYHASSRETVHILDFDIVKHFTRHRLRSMTYYVSIYSDYSDYTRTGVAVDGPKINLIPRPQKRNINKTPANASPRTNPSQTPIPPISTTKPRT